VSIKINSTDKKIEIGFGFGVPSWLFTRLFGRRRSDRLETNKALTGRASEAIEFGPITILVTDDRK
jgi:hypothetical protein